MGQQQTSRAVGWFENWSGIQLTVIGCYESALRTASDLPDAEAEVRYRLHVGRKSGGPSSVEPGSSVSHANPQTNLNLLRRHRTPRIHRGPDNRQVVAAGNRLKQASLQRSHLDHLVYVLSN